MKIGVMSDSHDNLPLIRKAIDVFIQNAVTHIVHCGDMVAPFVIRALTAMKEHNIDMMAVFGNNDGERAGLIKILRDQVKFYGDFHDFEWSGKKIALYHGTYARLLDALIHSQQYDLVLTGHTHQIRVEKKNKTLIINPGETCGYLTGKATVAIAELDQLPFDKTAVQIIDLSL